MFGRAPIARRLMNDESGAVLVLVALFMVGFLGIVALVVDLGGLYDRDRDLQTAADAGALAGAQELVYSSGDVLAADSVATDYVLRNTSPSSNVIAANLQAWSPAVTDRSVTIDLVEDHVPFFFAPVLGIFEGQVKARARAEVMYLTGVDKLFPVAINYMNPASFRFVLRDSSGATATLFDLTDPNGDGLFDTGATTFTPSMPTTYSISLQGIDSDGQVGVEISDIGVWRAADPSDPGELLYRVGMHKDVGGSTVTVEAIAAPTVTDSTVSATLGTSSFTLSLAGSDAAGNLVFRGSVAAPTKTGNEGYGVHDLTLKELSGNEVVGRYLALHPDAPLKHVMMQPAFYGGHSGLVRESTGISALVKTRVLNFGDSYVLKLGNQAGSGVYSGNWRIADVYKEPNVSTEIATLDPPDTWTLYHDLVVGGPLEPDGGAKVGQIKNGLDQRFSGYSPTFTTSELQTLPLDVILERMPEDDPYFIIIPIVEFSSLQGTSEPYKIAGFSGFYITNYTGAGDIEGVFIKWAASGEWSDKKPPGNLYIETAVITE